MLQIEKGQDIKQELLQRYKTILPDELIEIWEDNGLARLMGGYLKVVNCIFRKNCASVPEERSAIPLQTEQSSAGLLVAIIYSTIPARKFKTICLGCHSA